MSDQLLSEQTSGNDWYLPIDSMQLERKQAGLASFFTHQSSAFESLEIQMADHEAEFESTLRALRERFIFNNPEEIGSFLRTHRGISPLLLESVSYLMECFGPDAFLALEVMSEEGPPTSIYALVLWPGNRHSARAAIKSFDEKWWMNNFRKASGKVVFDYELIR